MQAPYIELLVLLICNLSALFRYSDKNPENKTSNRKLIFYECKNIDFVNLEIIIKNAQQY